MLLLEGRWTLQILLHLKEADLRFSDLRAALAPISANVLTQRMRTLEAAGLVQRRYVPPPAASHVYGLAAMAETIGPALDVLADWRAQRQQTHRSCKTDISGVAAPEIVTGENPTGETE
ncbi:MAG TPA: helix-turn-helix domain-containing protein [Sphingobium sp.]|uniref:winged helix-turn-helix transcriptional regulator n=1 Tax=Sphingobium sp. TaxID=1912891 RepID=UPI002ED2E015